MTNTSPAVEAQKQSSFQDAWAKVRQRNAERRALKQMFQDAELELAKITFEEIHTLMLEHPTTPEIANTVLVNLKRLDHPSVGLLNLESTPPKFSAKAIRFAIRGERTLTRDFAMNDYPFGGISISKERRVRYGYSRKTARDSKALGEYIYLAQTVTGNQVKPQLARKRMLLERIGFKCPGGCNKVILQMRAWVVGKAMKDKRWRSPVCKSCWINWTAKTSPGATAYLATSKDNRIPDDPTAKCPRCEKQPKIRKYWRISCDGYAICIWCRRKEPAGSTPPVKSARAKLPARIVELHNRQAENAWFKGYIASVNGVCQTCMNPVDSHQGWKWRERLKKQKEPCCSRCFRRWLNAGSPEGEFKPS